VGRWGRAVQRGWRRGGGEVVTEECSKKRCWLAREASVAAERVVAMHVHVRHCTAHIAPAHPTVVRLALDHVCFLRAIVH
jgi:hypothetical protein